MKPEDAEEYTQALGQVVAGGWRQIALGEKLGVPKALKLTTPAWVKERLGGYVKYSIEERKVAAAELVADGYSQRAIARVIGSDRKTLRKDRTGGKGTTSEKKSQQSKGDTGGKGTTSEAAPIEVMTGLVATNDLRQHVETKVAREQKETAREQKRQANAAKVAGVSDPRELLKLGRFATIVLDPPWDFDDEGDVNHLGRGKQDYASLSIDELLTLPVDGLADTDCHLYLWITNRSLPKGFRLLEAWGFRYVTCLTWVKDSFGLGNYFRGQTEQVLFGIKGSQALKRKDVGTVLQAPRGEGGHSSKPPEFFQLVESCSPAPYLEFFQREPRVGWTGWGENGKEDAVMG